MGVSTQSMQWDEKRVDKLKQALANQENEMRDLKLTWMQKEQELRHQIVVSQTEKNGKICELQRCVEELSKNNERIVSLEQEIYKLHVKLQDERGKREEHGILTQTETESMD